MLQSKAISAKRILKTVLITIATFGLVFSATVWAFGDKESLVTEIVKIPTFSTVENVQTIQSPTENLTEEISRVLAKELVEKNPEGPLADEENQGINGIDPDTLVADTLQKAIEEFDASALRATVDQSRIIFSASSDVESQAAYFKKMNSLIKSNFAGLTINYADPQSTNFPAFVKAYEKTVTELYALPVPRIISGFHASLIELIATKRNIYALIANYQTDPLQALLSLEFADQLEDELITLSNMMNQYLVDSDIQF